MNIYKEQDDRQRWDGAVRRYVFLCVGEGDCLVWSKIFQNAIFLLSDNIRPKSESIGYIIRCTFWNYFKPCTPNLHLPHSPQEDLVSWSHTGLLLLSRLPVQFGCKTSHLEGVSLEAREQWPANWITKNTYSTNKSSIQLIHQPKIFFQNMVTVPNFINIAS